LETGLASAAGGSDEVGGVTVTLEDRKCFVDEFRFATQAGGEWKEGDCNTC
jgi:hypothetical protein